MFDLFYMGGPLFMGMLTLIFIAMLILAIIHGLPILNQKISDADAASRRLSTIRQVGLLALVLGILGQLIGLYEAFGAIEVVGSVSPAMLMGGLKVSMITTLYGLLIFCISLLISLGLSLRMKP